MSKGRRKDEPKRALVLAGGGARGAYEAGVLAYVFNELPEDLLRRAKIHILCGTSVGAVHACYLAGTAHVTHRNVGRMLHMWRSFRLEETLRLTGRDLLGLPFEVRRLFAKLKSTKGLVVNSRVFDDLVSKRVSWRQIGDNLRNGQLHALTVTATHVASGRTVVFVDRREGGAPSVTRDVRVVSKAVRIGPRHALASAAIPFLFAAVPIDGIYYCDGGLRQNTPLSPALRMGADRVLVIGLSHEYAENGEGAVDSDGWETPQEEGLDAIEAESYPGPILMVGKIMDALLLDHLDYDLARLEGFNTLLRDGRNAFGPGFTQEMQAISKRVRGAGYREVTALPIRPSRDLGEMATEFMLIHREHYRGVSGWLLSKAAGSDFLANSDLLSYILFDGRFAEALIELGRADADAARESLIEFFKD